MWRLRCRQRQSLCLVYLFKTIEKSLGHSLRGRFALWKYKHQFVKTRNMGTQKLRFRVFVGKLRSAVEIWRNFTENRRILQSKADLASDFAGKFTKTIFFKAFK